jgi:RES domain
MSATGFRHNGPRARFDHHRRLGPFPSTRDDPERGILYAAFELSCSVAECFGDSGVVTASGNRLAVLRPRQSLRLLDLRRDGACHWYEHSDLGDLHGLIYPSATTSQDCIALWERAKGRLEVVYDWSLDESDVLGELVVIADALDLVVEI